MNYAWAARAKDSAEPVLQQISDTTFLGFPSQVYFLAYVVGTLVVLVVAMWKLLWSSDQKKLDESIAIGNQNTKQIHELTNLLTGVATRLKHLEDTPRGLNADAVKNLARKEAEEFHSLVQRMKLK